jgi:hypothetical protein
MLLVYDKKMDRNIGVQEKLSGQKMGQSNSGWQVKNQGTL